MQAMPVSQESVILPSPSLAAPPGASKAAWRSGLRRAREALAAQGELHALLSARLQDRLLASPAWRQSATVLLYRAVRGEADTRLLARDAWDSGKRVFLPRCRPGLKGQMDMLACAGPHELVLSAQGIPEPPASAPALEEQPDGPVLIVTPGLGFDRHGHRLGYGGGYYDRLLATCSGVSVGLAFRCQIVDNLPHDPWDIPVNALCTEEELLWI
jgi:5-formyltetrahydrofolate cyclo-ligase